jgi:TolB protein
MVVNRFLPSGIDGGFHMSVLDSRHSRLAFVLLALACTSDVTTRPIDEQSLVLAYTSETTLHCQIVLASLDGKTRTIPNSCGTAVAWSPDGTRLAFNKAGGEAAPPSLWVVNADGTGAAEVSGGIGLADPEWSPDGTRLAAVYLGAGVLQIIHADGSGRTGLAAASGLGFDRASWSHDGSEILFARLDTLWSVNVSSGAARVQCVPGLHQILGARWSPDGTRISVNARAPNGFGEFVMSADCSNQIRLSDGSFDGGWGSWSPDGAQIVYSSTVDSDGRTLDVFVVPSDGSGVPRNLTHNTTGNASFFPDWARAR